MTELIHYGTPRKSGRYPWGSGEKPQRSMDFKSTMESYRKQGLSDTEIAAKLNMSTTEMRRRLATANEEIKAYNYYTAVEMRESGKTNKQIGDALGMTEGGVRAAIKAGEPVIETQIDNITESLRERLGQAEYLDIGLGTEIDMGISRGKLLSAVNNLKDEGYYVHEVKIKQVSDPNKRTTILVLTKDPDSKNTYMNSDKIKSVDIYSEDGGLTNTLGLDPIKSIDSKRVKIRYAEDGGTDKDGVIELRQGHKDLDLGAARYAQVRIGVDGTHYLKGMAMYGDIPDGYDIVFNTNKSKKTPKMDVLKEMKTDVATGMIDLDNPFGATIKKGGQRGHLNIVNEEGDWSKWTDSLSSQMLSKQPVKLVKDRLDATMEVIDSRINKLNELTNPVVRKHFMEAYADELGSKVRSLKVEAIPRSKNHVLLPYPDMKPNEVYAPNFKNGEKVVLIRHPHGGTFEIPELTVNNKQSRTKGIKNALDAIGIHPSVAAKLSGADFDGDSVIVIPNNNKQIKFSRSLKGLKDFDPNQYYVGRKTMTDSTMQTQMGLISNLITDMTIKKASDAELAAAVRHSMVVIDAQKHQLDYKQSARDNRISALTKRYQTHVDPITGKEKRGAASTIISKSKQMKAVEGDMAKRYNPRTKRIETVKKRPILELVGNDARKLSSGSAVENQYVTYMNKVTAKRNKLEKVIASIPPQKTNPRAKKEYASEIKSLQSKVNVALSNAPRERQAQLIANKTYYDKLNYDMSKEEKKRLRSQALAGARAQVKSKRKTVEVTPREWKAIQAGAISNSLLEKVLRYGDQDKLIEMASPKKRGMNPAKLARAKAMLANGNTQADVAKALGISTSTLRAEL